MQYKHNTVYEHYVDLDNEAGFDTASVGDDILDFTVYNISHKTSCSDDYFYNLTLK